MREGGWWCGVAVFADAALATEVRALDERLLSEGAVRLRVEGRDGVGADLAVGGEGFFPGTEALRRWSKGGTYFLSALVPGRVIAVRNCSRRREVDAFCVGGWQLDDAPLVEVKAMSEISGSVVSRSPWLSPPDSLLSSLSLIS